MSGCSTKLGIARGTSPKWNPMKKRGHKSNGMRKVKKNRSRVKNDENRGEEEKMGSLRNCGKGQRMRFLTTFFSQVSES